jgi:hypothetical protein
MTFFSNGHWVGIFVDSRACKYFIYNSLGRNSAGEEGAYEMRARTTMESALKLAKQYVQDRSLKFEPVGE